MTNEELARLEEQARGFGILRFRNFRLFFTGNVISTTGFWMQSLAQSWLVVETLNATPFELGLVPIFQFGPTLIFGIPAGMIIDRFSKKRILMVTQFLSMLLALILALLTFTGVVQLWHVYAIGFTMGLIGALDMPSRQTFISELVPRYALKNAIALNAATFNLGRVIGPAIAGVLLALFGAAACFLLNGLSYLAPQISLLLMKLQPHRRATSASGFSAMKQGLNYVWNTAAIRRPTLLVMTVGSFGMAYNVWLPLLATESFKADERMFGVMFSAMGIGSFLGAMSIAFARSSPTPLRMQLAAIGIGVVTVSIGIVAAVPLHIWLATALLAASGFFVPNTMAVANTLVQTTAPDEFRGRVMAVYTTVFMGTMPLAGLIAGTIANRWGVEMSMYLGGGIVAIVATSMMLSQRERPIRAESKPIHIG